MKNFIREINIRLNYCVFSWLLCLLCAFIYNKQVMYLQVYFFHGYNYTFLATTMGETLFATLLATIAVSCWFTIPQLLYQSWSYTVPGRYERERKTLRNLLIASIIYAVFSLWLILIWLMPNMTMFLMGFNITKGKLEIVSNLRISSAITWFLKVVNLSLFAAFLPLVLFYQTIPVNFLQSKRKIIFLLIIISAAFLSPPDPWSQIMITLYQSLVFELVIWLSIYTKEK